MMLSEEEKAHFGCEIHVLEGRYVVTYFAEAVELDHGFVSFEPRYRIDAQYQGKASGEVLTFPSHLVSKVIRRMKK